MSAGGLCVPTHLNTAECSFPHLVFLVDGITYVNHIGTNLHFQNKCDYGADGAA